MTRIQVARALRLGFVLAAAVLAAACGGDPGAQPGEPAPLVCERVETAPHACASSGCWATLACNRDPSEEMGLSCAPVEGAWACKW